MTTARAKPTMNERKLNATQEKNSGFCTSWIPASRTNDGAGNQRELISSFWDAYSQISRKPMMPAAPRMRRWFFSRSGIRDFATGPLPGPLTVVVALVTQRPMVLGIARSDAARAA